MAGLVALNGVLYGTTAAGGLGYGTVFSITTDGTENVLYKFKGGSDGATPEAGLLVVNGVMYGTTAAGGSKGHGTVFSITTGGVETVLHSFAGAPSDGNSPQAGLIIVAGVLYGTTAAGGANGGGSVYSITTSGAEKVLYSFAGYARSDGANPQAGVVNVGGTLYGTTYAGGSRTVGCNCGTVFSVTRKGSEKVLHSFARRPDGSNPAAALVAFNGTLFGTTAGDSNGGATVFSITTGGTENVLYTFYRGSYPHAALVVLNGALYGTTEEGAHYGGFGDGTVFRINAFGAERDLYYFSGPDGSHPLASFIAVNGVFYGTTSTGGSQDRGTVFSLTPSGTEKVLYSFKGIVNGDGSYPAARLVAIKGTLYGTTQSGGLYGYGTVFRITTSGTEDVLYNFLGGSDGANPGAGLYALNGTLYGTTQNGGYGLGTVFSITTSGVESVLHNFSGGGDGWFPVARLVAMNGTLYGTTKSGGSGYGTVFSITTSGTETVLYSFKGGTDGASPEASLFPLNGTLYGTTHYGGSNSCGCGTVFSVTTSGVKTVLHRFGGVSDGAYPVANLFALNGTPYGTTLGGSKGPGTVFSITPSGVEKVLYNFAGGSDGASPAAGVDAVGSTLYGTTLYGGANKCFTSQSSGCGTVFSITTTGAEKVLYDFQSAPDGAIPAAGLFPLNGTLYATTQYGGSGLCSASNHPGGCGTAFSITTSGAQTQLYSFIGP